MLEKNFIYIICGREIDERFNETWYGSSNPVSFKIIKKQKQKNYVTNLCVLHQIAKSNYLFVVAGKSYFKSSDKISYLFYASVKIKKKKLVSLDENSIYTNLKTKTNQLKYNNKHIQKTKNSVQNSKPQGVDSANSVVSPRVSKKRLNELILSDQGESFSSSCKIRRNKQIQHQ